MTDDSPSKLPQPGQLAEENTASPIEPEVRDIECVVPSPPDVPMLTNELKYATRHIKLLHQTINPVPPSEFEKAKSFIISYLTLPHITKLTNSYQKLFLDAIGLFRRNPDLSSFLYEKLTIIEYRFPRLAAEFENAIHNQAVAESFIQNETPIMTSLKIFDDELKRNRETYVKYVEDKFRSVESEPEELDHFMGNVNQFVTIYYHLEVASVSILSAKRDIFHILNEVEDLFSDINL